MLRSKESIYDTSNQHLQNVLVSNPYKTFSGFNTTDLLLSLSFVVGSQFIKQFPIHFHEGFENIIDKSYNCLIPVLFGDFVQGWKHDG